MLASWAADRGHVRKSGFRKRRKMTHPEHTAIYGRSHFQSHQQLQSLPIKMMMKMKRFRRAPLDQSQTICGPQRHQSRMMLMMMVNPHQSTTP